VNGAIGSREQMHAMCAAQFAGSHLCHTAEYQLANSTVPVPADGAWIDASSAYDGSFTSAVVNDEVSAPTSGRYTAWDYYTNCANWTMSTQSSGFVIAPESQGPANCATSRVLACCSSVYREKFRGFTAATVTGSGGGRAGMHARCAAEFAGAHMCHAVEYQRSAPTITPPVAGAWVDPSGFATPTGGVLETRVASSNAGRWAGWNYYYNCENWTSDLADDGGTTARPGQTGGGACNVARQLACCE
jgi:hypothetical protein